MNAVDKLRVKIFADGADFDGIMKMYPNPLIKGFTTNPTLMRKVGITDYEGFARKLLKAIPDRPVSLEVFADDFDEMEAQAMEIGSWADNVYVKIPVTNTRDESSGKLLRRLSRAQIKVNTTALLTLEQVHEVADCLAQGAPSYISIFAGRIADTGVDPIPIMAKAVELLRPLPHIQLIWASPRELLNIFQADDIGCHVITATNDILKKLSLVGKDLKGFSLETVRMFHEDAKKAGYSLDLCNVKTKETRAGK